MSLALCLALAVAVALPAAVVLVYAITAEAGLQATVRQLGPARYIEIDWRNVITVDDYDHVRSTVPVSATEALSLPERLRQVRAESDSLVVEGGTSKSTVRLTAMDDLERHVLLVEGTQPVPPASIPADVWPITAPEAAVRNLGLRLDQVACFDSTNQSYDVRLFCARLVGIWRARDAHDSYWAERPVPDAVVNVDAGTLFEILHPNPKAAPRYPASAHLYLEPDLAKLHQDNAQNVLYGFRRLRAGSSILATTSLLVTSLDTAVQAFEDRLQLGQFSIQLVSAQLLLVAALAVAFISGHALERQRQTFAVWRSRGWSWHAIWRLLLLETAMLALPALLLGLAAGWLTAVLLARRSFDGLVTTLPPFALDRLAAAIALGLGVALAVIAAQAFAASRKELLEMRREASRPALRGWWQRRAVDLGLAVLSLPLVAATQLLGSSDLRARGAGSDPISLALPGLALILLGVGLLRLLPLAGTLSKLGAGRLPALLAGFQLRRRPVQHAGLALLIIVTTALGIFTGAYASSEPQGASDRAAYSVGADVRVHFDGSPPAPEDAIGPLRGVGAASFVYRGGATTAAGSGFQPSIVAVEPHSFQSVVWSRPGLTARPMTQLLQELADRDRSGLELPGRPQRLGVWASSAGLAGTLWADVVDAAGRPARAGLGRLDSQGWRYLEADLAVPHGSARYPLRLRDLAVEPEASHPPSTGTLALSELSLKQQGDTQPRLVDRFEPDETGISQWWRAPAAPNGVHLRAPSGHDGNPALTLDVDLSYGPVLVSPPLSAAPIPVLTPASTLSRAGLQLGKPFSMIVRSITAEFVAVDVAGRFPTLYPEAEDFMIVAQAPLLAAIAHDSGELVVPAEAWLRVTAAADAGILAALRARSDVTSVDDRRDAEAAARRDPVLLQLMTNLLLGFGAAMALTLLSVIVHFLITVQGRLGEYAILQANGLGRRTILRSLAIEQALLVAFAIVGGGLLGLGLSWALIPALQLGGDLTALVPSTVITVDPLLVGAVIGAVTLLALAGGRMAGRAGSRFRLMDELRLLG